MSDKPVAIELFAGLSGWGEGAVAAGFCVRGYDIVDMPAQINRPRIEGCELVLRDVRSLHGSELADAACIFSSSPCQEFSYRAMPWSRAKALPPPHFGMELFNHQFRIHREACEAAGRYIPLVIENVRGAQKWVGRAKANYGSYYLWGDVGIVGNRVVAIVDGKILGRGIAPLRRDRKNSDVGNGSWFAISHGVDNGQAYGANPVRGEAVGEGVKADGSGWTEKGSLVSHNRLVSNQASKMLNPSDGTKNGGDWFGAGADCSLQRRFSGSTKTTAHANIRDGHSHTRHLTNQRESDAVKFEAAPGRGWFDGKPRDKILGDKGLAAYGSKSNSRKAASALIAKIPRALAEYLARAYYPPST